MPRLLPEPTGRPSAATKTVLAEIDALASRPHPDGESRLIALRDFHHVFTAAMRAWEIELARAVVLDDDGPSVTDIADVTGLHSITVRERARAGVAYLPDAERKAAEAKLADRKLGPRKPGAPKRRTAVERLVDVVTQHGQAAYLVDAKGATGRSCYAVVVPDQDGTGWERLDGTVERLTVRTAVDRGLLREAAEEGPAPEYSGRADVDGDRAVMVEIPR